MAPTKLRVGIIGAGMGGLAAGISIARAGASVTFLEAANELGEIGAGIQMVPNVSRLLIRWGVDKIIGSNLVLHDGVNTYYGPEGRLVARMDPKALAKASGFPWWLVRRDHLHAGLSQSATRHGARLVVGARVSHIDDSGEQEVIVKTERGEEYVFDLLIGADGLRSIVRKYLFPNIMPQATSRVAAYRGVLSYERIYTAVPEARMYFRNDMDVWTAANSYVLTYPISGGKECNIVTAFVDRDRPDYVTKMEEIDIEKFRSFYKDHHPVVQKVIRLIEYTQCWPLLTMPRMERWSNSKRNIVLLGDSAHAMQNHMAQGAATAMEDAAFLGRALSEVTRGCIPLHEAIKLYEQRRIPKAWLKQQISFVSGLVNLTDDPKQTTQRNEASEPEVLQNALNSKRFVSDLPPTYRSWQFYSMADNLPHVFYYDAEGDADNAVCEYLQQQGDVDAFEMLSGRLKDKWLGYIDDNGTGKQQNGHAETFNGGDQAVQKADYLKDGTGR